MEIDMIINDEFTLGGKIRLEYNVRNDSCPDIQREINNNFKK
jgi:hypothetical protein